MLYALEMCFIFQYRTKNEQRSYFRMRSSHTRHNCHTLQFKLQQECDIYHYMDYLKFQKLDHLTF